MHAYSLFSQNNGTLYLNSTFFEYKCSEEGGWHDFFDIDSANGTLRNVGSPGEQDDCAKYTFHDVDLMLHKMGYDWFSIDTGAAKKVNSTALCTGLPFPSVLIRSDRHQTLDPSCSDLRQVWSFKEWVQDELNPVLEELADMPHPRMAFHIRGGDKLSEDVQLVIQACLGQGCVLDLSPASFTRC